MPFTLPSLPYATDALEPHIDKPRWRSTTATSQRVRHHLNKALESAPDLAGKSIEELLANNCAAVPEAIRGPVRNNGAGISTTPCLDHHGTGQGGVPVGMWRAPSWGV